jgi:hypothetical protein
MVIGSFGPWVTLSGPGGSLSASGTAQGDHGVWTAILAILALGLLAVRGLESISPKAGQLLAWGALGSFAVAGVLALATWSNLDGVANAQGWGGAIGVQAGMQLFGSGVHLDAGWGLIVVVLGAVAGGLCSFLQARRTRRSVAID